MGNSESNSYSTAPTVSKQKSIYNNFESLPYASPITTRTLTAACAVTITTVTGTTTTTTFAHWSRFRDWILLRRGDCNGNAYVEHSSEWVGLACAPAGYFFFVLGFVLFCVQGCSHSHSLVTSPRAPEPVSEALPQLVVFAFVILHSSSFPFLSVSSIWLEFPIMSVEAVRFED
jgi:hypothetical protein